MFVFVLYDLFVDFSNFLSLRLFGNLWGKSCTKIVIKYRFTCGYSDLSEIFKKCQNIIARIVATKFHQRATTLPIAGCPTPYKCALLCIDALWSPACIKTLPRSVQHTVHLTIRHHYFSSSDWPKPDFLLMTSSPCLLLVLKMYASQL